MCLFFLIAVLISKIERIIDGVEMEFFLFEFLWFESTFDGFHVSKATPKVFFGIEGLDSVLLLFVINFEESFFMAESEKTFLVGLILDGKLFDCLVVHSTQVISTFLEVTILLHS